jgi:hypothetical protein
MVVDAMNVNKVNVLKKYAKQVLNYKLQNLELVNVLNADYAIHFREVQVNALQYSVHVKANVLLLIDKRYF